jgi:predicted MFS family arabinose efflux permease
MAVIGDVFPESRRGRATSSLMTGFAVASVAGVPLGLVLGTHFGWQMPFIVLAVAGVPPLLLVPFALPKLEAPVGRVHVHPLKSVVGVFAQANHLNAFALMFALTLSSFMVFPYLSAYLVGNVGMSEQQLPLIYVFGGLLTLLASPIVGRMADRHGKLTVFRIIAPVSALLLVVITHLPSGGIVLAIGAFGCSMVCNVGRMIPAMAMVTSSVASPKRGAFLSVNSSIQHMTGGLGAYLGGLIVTQGADGRLQNFHSVGWLAAAAALLSLWLAGRLRVASAAPTIIELASAAATVDRNLSENVVGLRLKTSENEMRKSALTNPRVE